MRHGPTNVAQDGTKPRASPRPIGPHVVTRPLPPCLVIFSHPHIQTQTPHTKNIFSWCLYPLPLAYTHSKGISRRDVIFVSLSRPLSFLVLSLPRPLRESWIRGCSDSRTIPSVGLLDYEDTRLKTSSHVREGLSLAWKASLAIRICRSPTIVTDSM